MATINDILKQKKQNIKNNETASELKQNESRQEESNKFHPVQRRAWDYFGKEEKPKNSVVEDNKNSRTLADDDKYYASRLVRMISGHQKKIIKYLVERTGNNNGDEVEISLYLDEMVEALFISKGIITTSLKRLAKKNIIRFLPGKRGRYGFTAVAISKDVLSWAKTDS